MAAEWHQFKRIAQGFIPWLAIFIDMFHCAAPGEFRVFALLTPVLFRASYPLPLLSLELTTVARRKLQSRHVQWGIGKHDIGI